MAGLRVALSYNRYSQYLSDHSEAENWQSETFFTLMLPLTVVGLEQLEKDPTFLRAALLQRELSVSCAAGL